MDEDCRGARRRGERRLAALGLWFGRVADPEQQAEEELDEEGGEESWLERLYDRFQKHRRRLAFVAFVVFLGAVALELGGAAPREVRVSYTFPDHGNAREARIEYSREAEPIREVRLRWPDGAPREVRDTMNLSPGDYDISVLLTYREGPERHLSGLLTAPADGVVRVMLRE